MRAATPECPARLSRTRTLHENQTRNSPPPPRAQHEKESPPRLLAFDKLEAEIPNANLAIYKATYREVVSELQSMLTTRSPYIRPEKSRSTHPFVQTEMPEVRRDKFDEGEILSKKDFARKAIKRESPFLSADRKAADALPEDLKLAIDYITRRGRKIKRDRKERIERLRKCAAKLSSMRSALDKHKCKAAQEIAGAFNVAWTAAVIDAMDWPDTDLPVRYVKGFDVVFNIPDSGVFRKEPQPAEISRKEFMENNTRMVKTISDGIEKAAAKDGEEDIERRQQCWQRTKEEIEEGLVKGPFSKARMDKKYKRGKWRCIGRSAIKQKGKWRCIDNGKRSKHNKATSMHERITCGRADFPILIAREFARRTHLSGGIQKNKKFRMRHGTNDLRAAYRHVPVRQMQYTCVAVWDDDNKKVVYCDLPGHNFGLKSAVVNFNRFPELASIAARRLLWAVNEHYYDDNDTCEVACADRSGQEALVTLCSEEFFGFPFDPRKDEDMKEINEYLGVVSDLSSVDRGILRMDVSSKRRSKIKEITRKILLERQLASGLAASLFGKARFMLSPCFGSVGKACLQPIVAREYQRNKTELTTELEDSIEFVDFLCDALPPLELPLLPSTLEKVVIFTDAEGKQRDGEKIPEGHLGFVVYHPVHGKRYAYAKAPDDWVALFDKIRERKAYIGQYELAAAITPLLSLPEDWLRNRPVELWIDNSGAVGSLIKDYSGIPDCARIVNMFHFAAAKLGLASLWIDYVPSESNPADVPSRLHEMSPEQAKAELSSFGEPMEMILPKFADENGEWLSSLEIAQSIWS
jgi:hypothetical protein